MDRIGNEELWLFKDSIKTDQDIWDCDIDSYYVKERLTQKWRDRMLIEVEGGYYPRVGYLDDLDADTLDYMWSAWSDIYGGGGCRS